MEESRFTREEIALRILVGLVASSPRSIDDLCPADISPGSNPDRVVTTRWIIENAFRMADVFIDIRDKP